LAQAFGPSHCGIEASSTALPRAQARPFTPSLDCRAMLPWVLVLAPALCAAAAPTAAELRRWEGSGNCTGDYAVLNTDKLGECKPFLIPAPASVRVEYLDETTYSSYHYQGETDCSGARTKIKDFVVGSCEDLGGFSQMRVWLSSPSPPPGRCEEPGDCGVAYKACCAASGLKGDPCQCSLHNGTGEAGSPHCGFCGKAFVDCCVGFKLTGFPCSCDVTDAAAATIVV